MGELILHIGMPKTGTTSLQTFFKKNREKLSNHGIAYPTFVLPPNLTRPRNGIFLELYARCMAQGEDPFTRINDVDENLARLKGALSGHDRVLITNEEFSRPLKNKRAGGYDHGLLWSCLSRILEDAGATDVTIVAYLRRQDDWASSHWRQAIKGHHETLPLGEYCDGSLLRCSLDYADLLETASGAFQSGARLVVRPYNRATFTGGDIFRDFCAAAGIPWDDGYRISESDCNTSLSFDVAEALRQCYAPLPLAPYWNNFIKPFARELSKEYPDLPGTTPFDEEATRRLMEPYLEGNRRISERYLDGAPLFSEEYGGRPVWVPDEGRISECRAALQEAIRQHSPRSSATNIAYFLARRLPSGVKRFLRDLT